MAATFIVLTAVLVVAFLPLEHSRHPARGWAKAGASAAYLAVAVASGASGSGYGRWVLAALVLGWIGDVALVSRERGWFLLGLVAFLASHLVYVVAFAVLGIEIVPTTIAAAILLIPALIVGRWLWSRAPAALRAPILGYIAVISAMVAASIGALGAGSAVVIVVAASMFYVSDLFVARDRFVAPGPVNRVMGLPLYYAAQILFALSTGLT